MGSLSFDYSGETVVVTGGSSGIGRATALEFGRAGATVVVADVREKPKDDHASVPTHRVIREGGGEAEYVECDVADPGDVATVVEAARDLGGVDVMVNNAGLFVGESLVDLAADDLDRIIDVNVKGTFYGTQAAARDMRDRGDGGVILNTASISSRFAQKGQVQYDATKAAIAMITRGAALELAPDIRVNAVAPGQIATEFTENGTESTQERAGDQGFVKPVPLERAGFPEDLAPAYCYLASEEASYVTGEVLYVDGGWGAF
ncbi:SDR family NAD(P)-dependent oxidoreductase [Halomarina rubra]|uniref:SDR family NAD(P)-dependent oxidoreductase n=1 Tax=Halomarina rubra TaxID=2071873 RepID=A0ABD6AQH5_9EURY|nr:SDR family oxidoreductase [Halomarina rubra]